MTIVAGVLSALVVRRRIDALDLVAVLKTRVMPMRRRTRLTLLAAGLGAYRVAGLGILATRSGRRARHRGPRALRRDPGRRRDDPRCANGSGPAPVAGTLLRPTIQVGDAVERGQPVGIILPSAPDLVDPAPAPSSWRDVRPRAPCSARASTLMNEAEAARAQAEQDLRRIEAPRPKRLRRGHAARCGSPHARRASFSRRSGTLRCRGQSADLEQARAALSRLDELQRQPGSAAAAWQVRAPVAGRVLSLARDSGGPVGVGAELMTLGDVSRLEAVVDVLSTEATRIRAGAPVELSAGTGTVLRGRVRHVEPAAFTRVSALGVEEQRVNVVVDLFDGATPPGRVGHGFRVDARIELERIDDTLQVPTAALIRLGERWAVFTVRGQRARVVPIEVGAMSEATAVVKSALTEGDRVVMYPGDDLQSGARVHERTLLQPLPSQKKERPCHVPSRTPLSRTRAAHGRQVARQLGSPPDLPVTGAPPRFDRAGGLRAG